MSFFVADDLERRLANRVLFHGVSFEIAEGDTLAVLAPSGTGKSLLLRLLAGLDPLGAGTVRLEGRSQDEWGMTRWRTEVVYCPQRPPALPGTPADFAAEVDTWEAQRERERLDVAEIAADWEVDEVWEKPWAKLSGGEAQRAFLAISVASRPKVLLLDEPTSALDDEARDRVEKRLGALTSIWVTHDRSQAARVSKRRLELLDHVPEAP